MSIYEQLGVRPIINAKGPATRLSGGIMRPKSAAAWPKPRGLRRHRRAAGARLRGSSPRRPAPKRAMSPRAPSACLLLGTAACVAGLDPGRMARLPDTRGHEERSRDGAQPAQFLRPCGARRRRHDHRGRACPTVTPAPACAMPKPGRSRTPSPSARPRCSMSPMPQCPAAAAPRWSAVAHARAACRCIVDAAAQLPPQSNLRALHRRGRRSRRLLAAARRSAGPQAQRHSLRPARSRHGGGAPAPRSRHLLGAVGAASQPHRQGAAEGRAAARHRPAPARPARKRSSAC